MQEHSSDDDLPDLVDSSDDSDVASAADPTTTGRETGTEAKLPQRSWCKIRRELQTHDCPVRDKCDNGSDNTSTWVRPHRIECQKILIRELQPLEHPALDIAHHSSDDDVPELVNSSDDSDDAPADPKTAGKDIDDSDDAPADPTTTEGKDVDELQLVALCLEIPGIPGYTLIDGHHRHGILASMAQEKP